jgi:hypothetical protein
MLPRAQKYRSTSWPGGSLAENAKEMQIAPLNNS